MSMRLLGHNAVRSRFRWSIGLGLIAEIALAYARLAALTGDKLHRSKAEVLAGSIIVAQNPVTGQIFDNQLTVDSAISGSGDGGNRGEFSGRALMRLAQLWETKQSQTK